MKADLNPKIILMLLAVWLLSACSDPKPVKIGFIGGTSGRVADLGVAGRNGFLLAVEQQNKRGGINGRPIEFIFKDDKQNPQIAAKAVAELIEEKVDAIIGPMTSAMAMATVEQVNEAETVMMACTVTTDKLTGIDDYFLRPLSAIKQHSGKAASFIKKRYPELTFASLVIDVGNEAYTRDWAQGFQQQFELAGKYKISIDTFLSSNDTDFYALSKSILEANPDIVVLVTNSIDAALLSKQLKQSNPNVVLVAAEWAASERLIGLGGSYVEGLYVTQFIDRESEHPSFIAFKDAYFERFLQKPGYSAMFCFNATTMVLTAMQRSNGRALLKQELISQGEFQGVQDKLRMDKFGDTKRTVYMTQIQNGFFKVMGE